MTKAIPPGATHALGENFYRKAGRGAYVWRRDRLGWTYMEDTSARHAMRRARKLEQNA
jgi:hypothetical protein